MIVAMAGLPGTGKSTIARVLAKRLSAVIINKDTIRAALFQPSEIEYSNRQDDFVVDIMYRVAEYHLRKDPRRFVILDGRTFSRKTQVDALVQHCKENGRELRLIHCVCSETVARQRIDRDVANGAHPAANRGSDLYRKLHDQVEPLQIPHLAINTEEPIEQNLAQCLEYLEKIGKDR